MIMKKIIKLYGDLDGKIVRDLFDTLYLYGNEARGQHPQITLLIEGTCEYQTYVKIKNILDVFKNDFDFKTICIGEAKDFSAMIFLLGRRRVMLGNNSTLNFGLVTDLKIESIYQFVDKIKYTKESLRSLLLQNREIDANMTKQLGLANQIALSPDDI